MSETGKTKVNISIFLEGGKRVNYRFRVQIIYCRSVLSVPGATNLMGQSSCYMASPNGYVHIICEKYILYFKDII